MKQQENLGLPADNPYCPRVEIGSPEIPKMCILNRECFHCAFDQWMDAMEESEMPLFAEAA